MGRDYASTGIDDVMGLLLSVLPEFKEEWHQYVSSGLYAGGEPYNDVAQLAALLVRRMQAAKFTGFDRLFEAIEELLAEASPDVRGLITTGLLEDLQNVSLNNDVDLEAWESWLGPRTSEAWRIVKSLWNGRLTPEQFNHYVQKGLEQPPD